MNGSHSSLAEQIAREVEFLPENLVQEVLDFVGYLRAKVEQDENKPTIDSLLATFGAWKDVRTPDQIIHEIYTTRTISDFGSTP